MIDDFKFKPKTKRVELELVANKNEPFSSIDLTSALTKISSLYYKMDLLHSLAIFINQGVDFKDIGIFEKSLQNSFDLANLASINLFDDGDIIYKHGSIFSLFSNSEFYEISLILKTLKKINIVLRINNLNRIFLRLVKDILNVYRNDGFNDAMEYLHALPYKYNEFDSKQLKFIKGSIKDIIDKAISEQKSFISEKDKYSKLEHELTKKPSGKRSTEQKRISNRLLSSFFDNFNSNDFPVCFINDDNDLNILCHHHFSEKSYKNPLFFDIKEVSHNSPTIVTIIAAVSFVYPIIIGYQKIVKNYWDIQNAKQKVKESWNKKRIEENIKEQKQFLNDFLEDKTIGERILKSGADEEILEIESVLYREKMYEASERIKDEYNYFLKDYSFIVKSVKNPE
nr:hypothetical protein [uncultured Draconibacterium sp.]